MRSRVNTDRALEAMRRGHLVRLHQSGCRVLEFKTLSRDRIQMRTDLWDWDDMGTTEDFKRCHQGEIGFEVIT